jgi:ferrochelatase
MDPKVIDIPFVARFLLVQLIIAPFRAPRSARKYREIWTEKGSPLLIHMNDLVSKLQEQVQHEKDKEIRVSGAMRYGSPSLEKVLRDAVAREPGKITILPLYPQFAESTTGSVLDLVHRIHEETVPQIPVQVIDRFYDHPSFINAYREMIKEKDPGQFDHILFSYHGLPLRQVRKHHPDIPVETCSCDEAMPAHGSSCYRATCYETTRILASALNLKKGSYTTTFQSRLSRNWLSPFTDQTLLDLAAEGKKKVLIVPASFVADCLETTHELGEEYRELFLKAGGEQLEVVESLNSSSAWVKGVRLLLADS